MSDSHSAEFSIDSPAPIEASGDSDDGLLLIALAAYSFHRQRTTRVGVAPGVLSSWVKTGREYQLQPFRR